MKKFISSIAYLLILTAVGVFTFRDKFNASQPNTITQGTGWIKDGVDWYYFWSNGSMATGWVKSGDDWYYLSSTGAMASNTVVDGYYLNSSGAWVTKPGQPIYNGNEISKKLSDIGFFYKNGSYIINKYGQQGASQFKYISYSVHSGDTDMNLSVYASTSETDQKIKKILNWILPTQGSYLYNLMDTQNFKSQTLELDGRTVSIEVQKTYVSINFGPIK